MTLMSLYPWVLALHVTALSVFVGTLLAQLWLLKALTNSSSQQAASTLAMLQRLDSRITSPALMFTWIFGLFLVIAAGWMASSWLHVKLLLVVALSAFHGVHSGRLRRAVRNDKPVAAMVWAPAVVLLALMTIAMLVVLKPF